MAEQMRRYQAAGDGGQENGSSRDSSQRRDNQVDPPSLSDGTPGIREYHALNERLYQAGIPPSSRAHLLRLYLVREAYRRDSESTGQMAQSDPEQASLLDQARHLDELVAVELANVGIGVGGNGAPAFQEPTPLEQAMTDLQVSVRLATAAHLNTKPHRQHNI